MTNVLDNNLTLGVLKLMWMQCFLTSGLIPEMGLLSCFDWEVSSWTPHRNFPIPLPTPLYTYRKTSGAVIWQEFQTRNSIQYFFLHIMGRRLLCFCGRKSECCGMNLGGDLITEHNVGGDSPAAAVEKYCVKAGGRRTRWYLQVHPRTWRPLWPWHGGDRSRLRKCGLSLLKFHLQATVPHCCTFTELQHTAIL